MDLKARIQISLLAQSDTCRIRTIHSLCFRHVGAELDKNMTRSLITKGHEQRFYFGSNRLRSVSGNHVDELDFSGNEPETTHDAIYNELMRLRARMQNLKETKLNGWEADELLRMHRLMSAGFKRGYWDFTYLLERAVESEFCIKADFVGVDEIQDCTRLQIELLRKIQGEEVYFVGDPDQSIHSWAGANPKDISLLNVDETEDLQKSWRVPDKIADYAHLTLTQASTRSKGRIIGNGRMGSVTYNPLFEDVCSTLSRSKKECGEVFILGRTNCIAHKARQIALEYGLNMSMDENDEVRIELAKLIHSPAKTLTYYQFKFLVSPVLDARIYFKRGAKSRMRQEMQATPNAWMNWSRFFREYGTSELERLFRERDTSSLVSSDNQGVKIFDPTLPRVECLTMHSSKGLEADTVVILRDTTSRVLKNENHDEEVRLAYVAATRSKKNLIISEITQRAMRQIRLV